MRLALTKRAREERDQVSRRRPRMGPAILGVIVLLVLGAIACLLYGIFLRAHLNTVGYLSQ